MEGLQRGVGGVVRGGRVQEVGVGLAGEGTWVGVTVGGWGVTVWWCGVVWCGAVRAVMWCFVCGVVWCAVCRTLLVCNTAPL